MRKKIAVTVLACPSEVGFEYAEALRQAVSLALSMREEADVVSVGPVMENAAAADRVIEKLLRIAPDAVVVCIATWSEDHYVLELIRRMDAYLVLRAFPSMDSGSLCCAHQIASVFRDIDFADFGFVYGEADSAEAAAETCSLTACGRRAGKGERDVFAVGSVGGRVQGMTEIAFDEFALLEKCGAIVVPISETELMENAQAVTPAEIDAELPRVAGLRRSSTDEALRESLAYYVAMRGLCEKYRLKALAIKCYTRLMGKVCLGYSLLAEDGIVGACEGDVNNAVMMRILQDITGQCVNNTDLLSPDVEANTILFAHCGSSGFSIACDRAAIELAPVRLQDCGVCCLFPTKTGTVTLCDLVGHGDKLRMSAMVGEAVCCGMEFPGNPARVRFEKPVLEISKEIIAAGCGHHWMLGYGDVTAQLSEYCAARGILFQRIG